MPRINHYSPANDARVVIQYDRNGAVSVGVQRREGPTVVVDGVPAPATLTTTAPPEEFSELGGVFADLDRDGINAVIRHLREARDKAFGRDE